MNKITKLKKDKNFRKNFQRKELFILLNKYNVWSTNEKKIKQFYYYNYLKKFHLTYSKSRIVNRCLFSTRASWILRRFRLSRMMFKNFSDNGKIHGVRRSTW